MNSKRNDGAIIVFSHRENTMMAPSLYSHTVRIQFML